MTEDFDPRAFQRGIIAEFRANDGRVGGMFEGYRLCVLTTTGARTGLRRESVLGYFEVGGQPLVVASAMGSDVNPAWYHNVRANPDVVVETGTDTYRATAAVTSGARREALFADVVAQDASMGEYQANTARPLPVVTLTRVRGLGDFLREAHDWLRAELAELRREADRAVDGAGLRQQLRLHCREFCGALEQHHTGEDRGAFPMLAAAHPELEPELTRLGEEHKVVAALQADIRRLTEEYVPGQSDPHRLRAELNRLADELEAHFDYEERTVLGRLNAMGPAPDL
ncbi:nitroreductase/quinone reductase family protein [Amycolatopsis suaedae]|uniref:nitroreductase/quinone reductase family protein n=1 Tax=Amycolatopsis suaedae TaxID=2510978 RepID=UPI001F10C4EF|nr:nitroreductase/quinone reductase family protein [Amycolatopsis suaedae]